jgi:hypothetical protein
VVQAPAPGSGKGKEKVVPSRSASKVGSRSLSDDAETLSEDDLPLQRRNRLYHSDGSVVGGAPLSR